MPKRRAKVVVDRPIEVLAANGETALFLEPGRSKGTVVVFVEDGTWASLETFICPDGEEMLGPFAVVVKTDPDDGDEDDEDEDDE